MTLAPLGLAAAGTGPAGAPVLALAHLRLSAGPTRERALVVDDVSFELAPGGALGVVGESGSGKSLTLRALMALLPSTVRLESGSATLYGASLPLAGRQARKARRRRLGMVFQDPLSGLDPVQTVGDQIAEVPRRVLGLSGAASKARALDLLRMVGMPDPAHWAGLFPHQLSGGMRQRALIAMALATEPHVLLCDEPTTALDVTVQAQVLELLDDLRKRLGLSLLFVSHDLAVVRQLCDQVLVMYAGRVVERGAVDGLLAHPAHPYTLGLIEAVVDLDDPYGTSKAIPGTPPDPRALPTGCLFEPRCPFSTPDCSARRPDLVPLGPEPGRQTRCMHPERLGWLL